MNVLYLTEEPITFSGTMVRGGQIHVRNVVQGLRERGHNVHLVDWSDSPEEPYQHSIPTALRYGVDPFRTAVRSSLIGRQTDVDIVVSKTRKVYIPGLLTARILDVPHVIHVGSSPWSVSDSILGKISTFSIQSRIRAPHDGYLIVCEALRNELLKIGIGPKSIYDVRNAVDIDRFHPKQIPIALNRYDREQIEAFATDRFLLGFVGGLYTYKGLDDLADALGRVDTKFGVVIAGDGPERKRLERRFGEDGLFLGPVPYDRIPALYQCFDAFVLPSHTEGLPRVVLEAQATATPVVSTRVGGVPEIIEHGETGLLCDPKDPTGMASQLDRLANDEALGNRLGYGGRATVEANYTWSRLYDRYERYLRNMIAK
ncbi:MAG: glycosyltransferase family 4 protein [Halobacteriota archaeon]